MPSRPTCACAATAAAMSAMRSRRREFFAPMELADTPSFRLDGKRALVTGAGRGIGLAAASALAAAGAAVTPVARSRQEIDQAAAGVRAAGDAARAFGPDRVALAAIRA